MHVTENAFLQKYIREATCIISSMYKDLDESFIEAFVKKQIVAHCKDQPVAISNTYTEESGSSSLLNILHYLESQKPIITSNGVIYKPHREHVAPVVTMIISMQKERKDVKKDMFKAKMEKNTDDYERLDLLQANIKVSLNSLYGSMAEKNSFPYNASCAAAITGQARTIISATMWFLETFLANNVFFQTIDEMTHYMYLILSEENNLEKYSVIKEVPSVDTIVKYYMSKYENVQDRQLAQAIVYMIASNATDTQRIKLYYKCNLYAFINECPDVKDIIFSIIRSDVGFHDSSKPPPEFEEPLRVLWGFIEEFVYMENYILYDKIERYKTHTRKVVCYSDTDSVFIYTGDWLFRIMCEDKNIAFSDIKMTQIDIHYAMKTINILMYMINTAIHKTYGTLANNCGVAQEYHKYLSIKNEYLMDRYISYDMQKNYIYRNVVNEGNVLDPPEFESKGIHLNSKSKNSVVMKRLKDMVKHVTMDFDTIQPEVLLYEICTFRDEIISSIEKGEVKYLTPVKIKEMDSYKNPYSMYTVRAIEAYRIATRDKNLQIPGTFYIIDMKGLETEEKLEPIRAEYPDVYDRLKTEFFGDKNLRRSGIEYIAIPMRFQEIPRWIIPYIDITEIWRKHLNPAIALLGSVGIQKNVISGKQYHSTVLKF